MTRQAEGVSPRRLFYHPYAQIMPWAGVAVLFGVTWLLLHLLLVGQSRAERLELEQERLRVRQQLSQYAEARQAYADMTRVLAILPRKADFAPLALGLTDQARVQQVQIPGLTYQVEKTELRGVIKASLQGAMTGRYEDIRRFIHYLETADELLVIEQLDVNETHRKDQALTVNFRIVTYLRSTPAPGTSE